MANTYWIGDEEVNGTIVGGNYHVGGLYYNGRGPQGGKLYADTADELYVLALAKKRQLLNDCGDVANQIYPNDSAWELRIYD